MLWFIIGVLALSVSVLLRIADRRRYRRILRDYRRLQTMYYDSMHGKINRPRKG